MYGRDAGLLRLKGAIRITVAAALTLVVLAGLQYWIEELRNPLVFSLAGLTSMLLMMLAKGQNRKTQKTGMILSSGIILVEIIFINLTAQHPYMQSGLLCFLGFAAFYIRRYGLHYMGAGLSALFLYIIFPSVMPPDIPLFLLLVSIITAITIAFIMNFYFLADDPVRAYRDSVKNYVLVAAEMAGTLQIILNEKPTAKTFVQQEALLVKAYNLADNAGRLLPMNHNEALSGLRLFLIRLHGSMIMLSESLADAEAMNHPTTFGIKQTLSTSLKLLHDALYAQSVTPNAREEGDLLQRFQEQIALLRGELETNKELFTKRFAYLARMTFSLKRLCFTLQDGQGLSCRFSGGEPV